MERLSASELLDRNDRQSGNINPDSTGFFSAWPTSKKIMHGQTEQLGCTAEVFHRSPLTIKYSCVVICKKWTNFGFSG